MILALALVLAATVNTNTTASTIQCRNLWSPEATERELIAQFGRANVRRDNVYVAEGTEEPGTILFPNDPKRRVEIVWRNKSKYARPEWLRIPADSRWTAFGVRPGMSLAELQTLNGRAFIFSGFDWDYGGFVTNWKSGKVGLLGGDVCNVSVRLDAEFPENLSDDVLGKVSGEVDVASNSRHLKGIKIWVGEVIVSYEE